MQVRVHHRNVAIYSSMAASNADKQVMRVEAPSSAVGARVLNAGGSASYMVHVGVYIENAEKNSAHAVGTW